MAQSSIQTRPEPRQFEHVAPVPVYPSPPHRWQVAYSLKIRGFMAV